ncbi:hypothetical protein OGATHE_004897, partial [Ogataea polymorpha]
ELGATEDDLKLLDGIDEGDQSEQEFDFKDDDTKDGAFGNELESFMKNLGFTGQVDVVDDDIVAKEEPIPEEDLE